MRMKAMKTFRQASTGDVVNPGQAFFEPNAGRAQHYEREGMAYPAGPERSDPVTARPAKVRNVATKPNEAADAGPLASTGGETGAARSASSSPAAPRPRKPRSTSRKAAPTS